MGHARELGETSATAGVTTDGAASAPLYRQSMVRDPLLRMPPPEAAVPEAAAPVVPLPPPLRVLIPSPLGMLAVELRGQALTALRIAPSPRERSAYTPFVKIPKSDFLDDVFGKLSEYLAGARRELDLDYSLDAANLDAFAIRVLRETARIPYGRTRTYAKVAAAAGRPEAYRQVLTTLLANPLPLIIPCHRVVSGRSGVDINKPGSYLAGTRKKVWLLKMERNALASAQPV